MYNTIKNIFTWDYSCFY